MKLYLRRFTFTTLALLSILATTHSIFPASRVSAAISADPSDEIVFVTDAGFIQVLDPSSTSLAVQWVSPTGGWDQISLCDVNADGDMEIVAMSKDGPPTIIAVFDPVIASGPVDPNKKINGIPWDTLYSQTFNGKPEFIICDNFDNGIPGDEIAMGYEESPDVHRVYILNAEGSTIQPNGRPTGRGWKLHIEQVFDHEWIYATSGNLNDSGADELVLFDGDSVLTRFDVFDMDRGMLRVDGKSTDSHRWRRGAIGQVRDGGKEELVAIRSIEGGNNDSLYVYVLDGDDELRVDESWLFAPNPEFVFLADITGNGDKEIFFLRNHRSNSGARLIMLDEWGNDQDRHIKIEDSLGGENVYRVGAGGDVDGDGREEIMIMRNDRIRLYLEPERSISSGSYVEFAVATNRNSIAAGDLDGQGFISGPQFGSDKSTIAASTPIGTQSANYTFQLTNLTSNEGVPFSITRNYPSYITVTPTSGTTPATINVRFDATNLSAGRYVHTLEILSSNPTVVNVPFHIQLELTVDSAAVETSQNAMTFVYNRDNNSCEVDPVQRSLTMRIGGTNGLNFRVGAVEMPEGIRAASAGLGEITQAYVDDSGGIHVADDNGNSITIPGIDLSAAAATDVTWPEDVPWITEIKTLQTSVPSTITIGVDATGLTPDASLKSAVLVIVADNRAGLPPENVQLVPINMLCADTQIYLPASPR